VLGGGCFFNRIIKTRIVSRLEAAGLFPLEAKSASCGDAGLALGQAWAAACRLKTPRGVHIHSEKISCA
jgi:hydrogenase maturation protein HypF